MISDIFCNSTEHSLQRSLLFQIFDQNTEYRIRSKFKTILRRSFPLFRARICPLLIAINTADIHVNLIQGQIVEIFVVRKKTNFQFQLRIFAIRKK